MNGSIIHLAYWDNIRVIWSDRVKIWFQDDKIYKLDICLHVPVDIRSFIYIMDEHNAHILYIILNTNLLKKKKTICVNIKW